MPPDRLADFAVTVTVAVERRFVPPVDSLVAEIRTSIPLDLATEVGADGRVYVRDEFIASVERLTRQAISSSTSRLT